MKTNEASTTDAGTKLPSSVLNLVTGKIDAAAVYELWRADERGERLPGRTQGAAGSES